MSQQCSIRWRPSGGRGEFEVTPAQRLADKRIFVRIPALGIDIDSETHATISQGKPRLRKYNANDRSKLHLVQLVMALARLPDPAREDKTGTVSWPLENKQFVIANMDFDIVEENAKGVVLEPLNAKVLHSPQVIDLRHRFDSIRKELASLGGVDANLANAIQRHHQVAMEGKNTSHLRELADEVIRQQSEAFGPSNTALLTTIKELPPTPLEEDIKGKEGRILTRLHSYRERDPKVAKAAKALFKAKHSRLFCECCGFEPASFYGERGENRIQAHHKTAVEQLLPDSITTPADLAMVCPNCHDIIHAKRPWLDVEELKQILVASGKHHFK